MTRAVGVFLMLLAFANFSHARLLAGRALQATATARAMSTGGKATSVSQATGTAQVDTVAVPSNNGTATAIQSADSGEHAQVTVASGDNVTTIIVHKPATWTDAPACKASPNSNNSQADDNGRLWGFTANVSCAYKDAEDHPIFFWEAAPVCPDAPTADSIIPDNKGRLWGWANGASCAYKSTTERKLLIVPASRKLSATATATATSYGGKAASDSHATGNAEVDTTTVAAKGGEAVAVQSADQGTHSQTTAAVGNSTFTVVHKDGKSFDEAPVCKQQPLAGKVDIDAQGNKWGWEKNTSCAFRNITTEKSPSPQQSSEHASTGPACPANTNVTRVDETGRKWGWVKTADGKAQSCIIKVAPKRHLLTIGAVAAIVDALAMGDGAQALSQADAGGFGAEAEPSPSQYSTTDPTGAIATAEEADAEASPAVLKSDVTSEAQANAAAQASAVAQAVAQRQNGSAGAQAQAEATAAAQASAVAQATAQAESGQNGSATAQAQAMAEAGSSNGEATAQATTQATAQAQAHTPSPSSGNPSPSAQATSSAQAQSSTHTTSTPSPSPSLASADTTAEAQADAQANATAQAQAHTQSSPTTSSPSPSPVAAEVTAQAQADAQPQAQGDAATQSPTAVTGDAAAQAQASNNNKSPSTSPQSAEAEGAANAEAAATTVDDRSVSPVPAPNSSTDDAALSQALTAVWEYAPKCQNKPDDCTGDCWGWENGKSCTFSTASDGAVSASQAAAQSQGAVNSSTASPSPSGGNAVADTEAAAQAQALVSSSPAASPSPSSPVAAAAEAQSWAQRDGQGAAQAQAVAKAEGGSSSTVEAAAQAAATEAATAQALAQANSSSSSSGKSHRKLSADSTDSFPSVTLPVEVAEVSDAAGTDWKYGTASFHDESISTAESADSTDVLNAPVSAVESPPSVNTSSTNVSDATWETAPACVGKPREETAVQDAVGRLWWSEEGVSCAYRNAAGEAMYYAGYQQVDWDTAEPCGFAATKYNAMKDAQGRAWGWMKVPGSDFGMSCKFLDHSGQALPFKEVAE